MKKRTRITIIALAVIAGGLGWLMLSKSNADSGLLA